MVQSAARSPGGVVLVTTDLAVGGAQSLMAAMAKHFAAAGRRVAVVSLEGDGPYSADLRANGVRPSATRNSSQNRFDVQSPKCSTCAGSAGENRIAMCSGGPGSLVWTSAAGLSPRGTAVLVRPRLGVWASERGAG